MPLQNKPPRKIVDLLANLENELDACHNKLRIYESLQENTESATDPMFSLRVDNLNSAIFETDAEGIVLYICPTISRITGIDRAQIVGKPLDNFGCISSFQSYVLNVVSGKYSDQQYVSQFTLTDSSGQINFFDVIVKPVVTVKTVTSFSGLIIGHSDKKGVSNWQFSVEATNDCAKLNTHCSCWKLNVGANQIYRSKSYFSMMEMPIEENDDVNSFRNRVHPDDLSVVDRNYEQLKNTRQPVSYDVRLRTGNHYKWIHSHISPEFVDNQLVWLYGVNIDVTIQKLAEEKVRYQNDKLNAILKAVPDLVFVYDMDGNSIEYFSEEPSKLLVPPDQIQKTNVRDLFDAEMSSLILRKIKECLHEKVVQTISYEVVLPNSKSTHFEARIVPLDNDKVLVLSRDITDHVVKDNEIQKLSLAVEQSSVSIIITDLDAIIVYVNPKAVSTYGFSKEVFMGSNVNILNSGLTNEAVFREMWDTISSGKVWNGEWINRSISGEILYERVSISPLQDQFGNITNYLAVQQDITEQKKAEEAIRNVNLNLGLLVESRTKELEDINKVLIAEIDARKRVAVELIEAREEAEKANLAKSEFLSRMSHELRTPLNSILGFAQLISLDEGINKSHRKGLDYIIKGGNHLLEMINELLDLSKIEAGRITMHHEEIDLNKLLLEMVDMVTPKANSNHIRMLLQTVPLPVGYCLDSDKKYLRQILLNLIQNAVKFNRREGSVVVSSLLENEVKGKDCFVRISVKDTGLGISKEDMQNIFKPFSRFGEGQKNIEGTGLGLTIAKNLSEVLGGKIIVESELGIGSTFTVMLPLKKQSKVE